jgi:hypothetical protein
MLFTAIPGHSPAKSDHPVKSCDKRIGFLQLSFAGRRDFFIPFMRIFIEDVLHS